MAMKYKHSADEIKDSATKGLIDIAIRDKLPELMENMQTGSASVKVILKKDLPQSAPEGQMILCSDTSELYIGTSTGVSLVASRHSMIDGGEFGDTGEENVIADGGTF